MTRRKVIEFIVWLAFGGLAFMGLMSPDAATHLDAMLVALVWGFLGGLLFL